MFLFVNISLGEMENAKDLKSLSHYEIIGSSPILKYKFFGELWIRIQSMLPGMFLSPNKDLTFLRNRLEQGSGQ